MDESRLVEAAVTARTRAYAPYSAFPVGAALLSKGGRLFAGCNVENASYGLTVCAERVALLRAISEGVREFEAIAVACGETPCSPCGACRQVLREFAPDLKVILADGEGRKWETTLLSHLLPRSFGPSDLA